MPNHTASIYGRQRRPPSWRAEVLEPRVLLATVSGTVFNDLDRDGAIGAGEIPMEGWTVYQDLNDNNVLDAQDRATVTGANGTYTLTLFPIILGPQTAHIRVVPLNSQWTVTAPAGGVHTFVYRSNNDAFSERNFFLFQAPLPPQNVVVVQRALGIRVMFTDVSWNETQFIVQRKLAAEPDSAFVEVGRVGGTAVNVHDGRIGFTGISGIPGQTYHYRVLTVNGGGTSLPSNTAVITAGSPPAGTGARATWFNDRFFAGPPLTLDAPADADEYFPYPLGTPDPRIDPDTFSGAFAGLLTPEFTELYTLYTASDDGIDLALVDPETGEVLLDGPPDGINILRPINPVSGFQDTLGPIQLVAGKQYLLRWRMSENTGEAGYRVGWSSPRVAQEVLPVELMVPARLAPGYLDAMQCGDDVVLTFLDLSVAETGTELQRAAGPVGPFQTIAAIPAPGTPVRRSFIDDSPLTVGQTYYYRMRATMYGADGAPSAPVAVTIGADPTRLIRSGDAVLLPGPDGDPTTAADNVLRLTDLAGFDVGSVFTTQGWDLERPSRGTNGSSGFSASFTFTMPRRSDPPADGFAFVLQRSSPTAVGEVGNGLGYQNISNSLAIKFDLYAGGVKISRTNLYANGWMDDAGGNVPFDLSNGNLYRVDISYDSVGRKLFERITNLTVAGVPFETTYSTAATGPTSVAPLILDQLLGQECAYVGFTGATGASLAEQQITAFSINGQNIPLRDPGPPRVAQVYVAGSGWSAAFRQKLESAGLGSARFGFAVPAGAAQIDGLPWANLDEVSVAFDSDVRVEPGHLSVNGFNFASYPLDPASFRYDVPTRTATWRLAAGRKLSADRLTLGVGAGPTGVGAFGNPLDGDWINPAAAGGDAYPSGDGTPGGDFRFALRPLPGDVTADGKADASDLLDLRARLSASIARPRGGPGAYSLRHDLDGNGAIDARDYAVLRVRLGDALPATPALAPAAIAEVIARAAPLRRQLFAVRAILESQN
jgi:hypothetical protein